MLKYLIIRAAIFIIFFLKVTENRTKVIKEVLSLPVMFRDIANLEDNVIITLKGIIEDVDTVETVGASNGKKSYEKRNILLRDDNGDNVSHSNRKVLCINYVYILYIFILDHVKSLGKKRPSWVSVRGDADGIVRKSEHLHEREASQYSRGRWIEN